MAKPDIRLYMTFETQRYSTGSDYAHIYARPMILEEGKFGDKRLELHSPDSYEITRYSDSTRALKGLQVSCQTDTDDARRGRTYAEAVEYTLPTVTLREAEAILPWLRKIDRGTAKLREQFGYPADYPAYLTYVAAVLLPKQPRPFIRVLEGDDRDVEGTGYRAMDPNAMRDWCNRKIKEWQ